MPTIKFKKEVEESLEIECPLYINTGYSIALIFDEANFIHVKYDSFVNYAIEQMNNDAIVSRWLTDNRVKPTTRLEFLKAYNEVATKISQLIPD